MAEVAIPETNPYKAIHHNPAKIGRSSPPRKVPICTPDCLIPVTTPLAPGGTLSTISAFVEGLPQALERPVMRAAVKSTA